MAGIEIAQGMGVQSAGARSHVDDAYVHYRIVAPSYEISTHLDEMTPEARTEWCGRICYKSEDKITEDSAIDFVQKTIKKSHNSVLEMAVGTYEVIDASFHDIVAIEHEFKQGVIVDEIGSGGYIITVSMRTLREMYMLQPANDVVRALVHHVAKAHPIFFEDLYRMGEKGHVLMVPTITKIGLQHLDQVIRHEQPQIWRRHRFIAAKFIVSRAVTHELVRHRPCSFLQESQRYCNYGSDKFNGIVTLIKPIFYKEGTPEYDVWERSTARSSWDYLTLLKTSTPQAARTVMPNSCKTEIIAYCNIVQWGHICYMRTSPAAEPSMREVMIPLQNELRELFPGESFDKRSPEGYLVAPIEDQ